MTDSTCRHLDFTELPPFPDNVPTVPLLRISLEKIAHGDQGEQERMWEACRRIGFFYLDLHSDAAVAHLTVENAPEQKLAESNLKGSALLQIADSLFKLGQHFFELPEDEKQKYDYRHLNSYFGYKGFGAAVVDAGGTRDRNEFYNVSKDFVLGIQDPLPEPPLLTAPSSREVLSSFIVQSHAIVSLLLRLLASKLELEQDALARLHRLRAVSGDQIRWVRSPAQPENDRKKALGEHTDFGSVTLLFNKLGGLQVLPPNQQEWSFVRPLKGHCVVNLGDALVKFSAGILRSNLHRVVNPPGEQASLCRMSLVYFARPEDHVKLRALSESKLIAKAKAVRGLEDEDINAKDWILRRALGRRVGGDFIAAKGTEVK